MRTIEGYVHFYGELFSPSEAEKISGVTFDEKKERGDIGIRGKYKGVPIPYGSAYINFEHPGGDPDLLPVDMPLLNILERFIPPFRAIGAEDISLWVNVFYTSQCNLELSPELLQKLAGLGIPLCISTMDEGAEEAGNTFPTT
jgi:hypothetical protein